MIPKKLHFTYRTDLPPQKFQENMEKWRALCPDWEIHYYSDQAIFAFFETHFPHYVSDISKITLGAVLADVFRYGLLFVQGGMYADIDTVPLKTIPEKWLSYASVLGYEYQASKVSGEFWYKKDVICQWAMLSAPKHPLFKESLDQSIANLREKNFRHSDLKGVISCTGPLLFTSFAEKYLNLKETLVLDMEIFGANPKIFPKTARSVVEHQFHGEHGWTLGVLCPFIDIH